ncbi:Marginal zone B- and B1-cell-specific protein like [Argiope bruennichi]|uniref:Marginal zone B- and B1-cell-specific protein like n=1 Tax=Argiope bruennichi TaxID=94029 RepID=A0A8T0EJY5_ARGBR|nr:Marginal zone B- and B1-cell-specific protein like [Argiope bruennichi]
MDMRLSIILMTVLFCSYYPFGAEGNDVPKGEKISLSIPSLTEEEINSNHMPFHMKCDACKAISFQIREAFDKKRSYRQTDLEHHEILDILEELCGKGFNDYGVKQVNGVNRLSGPGLETEHVMGMTQMGGHWPNRLRDMCFYYVGEAGEIDMYDTNKEGPEKLMELLCYGKGVYGHCSQLKSPIKTEL